MPVLVDLLSSPELKALSKRLSTEAAALQSASSQLNKLRIATICIVSALLALFVVFLGGFVYHMYLLLRGRQGLLPTRQARRPKSKENQVLAVTSFRRRNPSFISEASNRDRVASATSDTEFGQVMHARHVNLSFASASTHRAPLDEQSTKSRGTPVSGRTPVQAKSPLSQDAHRSPESRGQNSSRDQSLSDIGSVLCYAPRLVSPRDQKDDIQTPDITISPATPASVIGGPQTSNSWNRFELADSAQSPASSNITNATSRQFDHSSDSTTRRRDSAVQPTIDLPAVNTFGQVSAYTSSISPSKRSEDWSSPRRRSQHNRSATNKPYSTASIVHGGPSLLRSSNSLGYIPEDPREGARSPLSEINGTPRNSKEHPATATSRAAGRVSTDENSEFGTRPQRIGSLATRSSAQTQAKGFSSAAKESSSGTHMTIDDDPFRRGSPALAHPASVYQERRPRSSLARSSIPRRDTIAMSTFARNFVQEPPRSRFSSTPDVPDEPSILKRSLQSVRDLLASTIGRKPSQSVRPSSSGNFNSGLSHIRSHDSISTGLATKASTHVDSLREFGTASESGANKSPAFSNFDHGSPGPLTSTPKKMFDPPTFFSPSGQNVPARIFKPLRIGESYDYSVAGRGIAKPRAFNYSLPTSESNGTSVGSPQWFPSPPTLSPDINAIHSQESSDDTSPFPRTPMLLASEQYVNSEPAKSSSGAATPPTAVNKSALGLEIHNRSFLTMQSSSPTTHPLSRISSFAYPEVPADA